MISAEGERALRGRLTALERQHEEEFVARLREARAFGDASVNDDLLQIREEEAVLASRIARLRALLETATVVDNSRTHDGRAGIGTRVEVEDLDSGTKSEVSIADGHESLPEAASAGSPIGQALLGNGPGTAIEVKLPNGRTRRLRIVAVHRLGPS